MEPAVGLDLKVRVVPGNKSLICPDILLIESCRKLRQDRYWIGKRLQIRTLQQVGFHIIPALFADQIIVE
jgi:hypothetical protein